MVQRRGGASWTEVVSSDAVSVARLSDDIVKKFPSLRDLDPDRITLRLLVGTGADGKDTSVELESLDKVGEALGKATQSGLSVDMDKLRIVVDATSPPPLPLTTAGKLPSPAAPPTVTSAPSKSVDKSILEVAMCVKGDIAASGDLETQRERTGLGSLLLKPFPLSSLDSVSPGVPALTTDFLPYVGNANAYRDALESTTGSDPQRPLAVAVVQASGSGKTRLAYEDGMSSRLVIIARVWKHGVGVTPAWATYMKLAGHWASLLPHLGADERSLVSQSALATMRLLAACHVRFVGEALQHIVVRRGGANSKASPAELREAALRCLRNGKGDDRVGELFCLHLKSMMANESLPAAPVVAGNSTGAINTLPAALVDAEKVKRFCEETDALLRDQLWPNAQVSLYWDEAHTLIDKPAVFERIDKLGPMQDCFYGLTAAAAQLVRQHGWLQTLCGSWMDLTLRVDANSISPLRGRVATVFHASYIRTEDMLSTLQHFLALDAETVEEVSPLLDKLRGRPIFFFTDFMTALWEQLCRLRPADPSALRDAIVKAAAEGELRARARMDVVFDSSWLKKPVVLQSDVSSRSLCMELYAALRLNGGKLQLGESATAEALRRGLLAVPLPARGTGSQSTLHADIDLDSEPVTRRALKEIGASLVRESRTKPDLDPIFQLLAQSMGTGSIAGFDLTTSVQGDVLELAFAWHVLRRVMLHAKTSTAAPQLPLPLAGLLKDLLAPGFVVPTRAEEERVVASVGLGCDNGQEALASGLATDLHLLCEPGAEKRVLFDFDHLAGIDVGFCSVLPSGEIASAVTVQAKAQQEASMLESIRAASAAWQFTDKTQRRLAMSGSAFNPTAKRVAFQELATTTVGLRRFDEAFRVVLSATGFRPRTVSLVNKLNADPAGCKSSPILLCQPSASAFGKILTEQLRRASAKGAPMSHTKGFAYLLPQRVGEVTAGKVTSAYSPSVDKVHKSKP